MDFTLKKYKKEIEESRAGLKAASEFKEQDRVPNTNILFRRVFMEVAEESKGL